MDLKTTLICGIGNKLRKDDGIGPYIINELEKYTLPPYVNCIDAGISAFKTALLIGQYHKVIFIDAIKKGNQAGCVYRVQLNKEEFGQINPLKPFVFSFHETNLENVLSTAISLGTYPAEAVVIGCEPKDISSGLELSKEIIKSVDRIIDCIYKELSA